MNYLFHLMVCFLLFARFAVAQPQKGFSWSYSGSLSIGLNIPQIYENHSDELSFLTIASETISNPGLRLSGTAYYGNFGFNMGFGNYQYLFNDEKFENERGKHFFNDSVSVYMSEKIRAIPVFAGLSYYLKIKDFSVEPEFLVRYNKAIVPDYVDVYFWDNTGLIKNISYLKKSCSRFDFVPGIKLNYLYTINHKRHVGVQFSYHYSFSNPELEYLKREADIENRIVNEETHKAKLTYATSNFSFGLVIKFD